MRVQWRKFGTQPETTLFVSHEARPPFIISLTLATHTRILADKMLSLAANVSDEIFWSSVRLVDKLKQLLSRE
jgi:hypothetical protein